MIEIKMKVYNNMEVYHKTILMIYNRDKSMLNKINKSLNRNPIILTYFMKQWLNVNVIQILIEYNKDLICFKKTIKVR
jgi:predicted DNA-binding ArsR family transcriptional regulator